MSAGLPLLDVRGLTTWFPSERGTVRAVDGIDLTLEAGECAALVGESGSGKSATALSVIRLLRPPGRIERGSMRFDGCELTTLDEGAMRELRGRQIAITMQDALAALNPALTIGAQITESARAHEHLGARAARERAVEMMRRVGIPSPEARLADYPHRFSGGMRQRVMIAIALACRPRLLIADEPTTALDVTIQAQVLDLIASLQRDLGMAVLLITHDLGVVAERCARVYVMYAGQIVESGSTAQVIGDPQHPYTQGLIASIPHPDQPDRAVQPIEGAPPSVVDPPPGCRFGPRCKERRPACDAPVPLMPLPGGRVSRCVLATAGRR